MNTNTDYDPNEAETEYASIKDELTMPVDAWMKKMLS